MKPPHKITEPTIIVIFGGSGDLARRKLIPALYNLYLDKWLNEHFKIICLGRTPMTDKAVNDHFKSGIDKFSRRGKSKAAEWKAFSEMLEYETGDFTQKGLYTSLRKHITSFEKEANGEVNKIFYLAVAPDFFGSIARMLHDNGMDDDQLSTRIVVEKPFGTDLESARMLNNSLLEVYDERQLYRIDHYLGKETVQNLLAFRFANALFEPIWNRNYIDHVQISVSEKIGVEDRGGYYETSGALRDMIQNHVLQLLCLIAMEPPVSFDADEIRSKKADVLHAIKKYDHDEVRVNSVRGQYSAGWLEGDQVKAYREEKNVDPESRTETFAAAKFFVNNWRWNDVPFYVRSGKRMQRTVSVITIQFKKAPHQAFPQAATDHWHSNKLIIHLQPDMGIRIRFQAKKPGLQMHLTPVDMLFDYGDTYTSGIPEGYETLLLDVIEGDATLFMRADQVEAAWEAIMPILNAWKESPSANFPNYPSGTNGPETAEALIARDGRNWFSEPYEINKQE